MNDAIIIVAKFIAKDGKADELHKALHSLIGPTRNESGCLIYELHQDLKKPNVFTMIEKFKDKISFDSHCNQPYFLMFKNLYPSLVVSSTIDLYKIAGIPIAADQ